MQVRVKKTVSAFTLAAILSVISIGVYGVAQAQAAGPVQPQVATPDQAPAPSSNTLQQPLLETQADSSAATSANEMVLRKIMRDLDKNMQAITHGIAQEDWASVAKIAPLIADHPQPPLTEKIRILTFLGTDAFAFRGHDHDVHQAAVAIGQAAAKQDGAGVISAFANVQTSCLACHQGYRKSFMQHFYPDR